MKNNFIYFNKQNMLVIFVYILINSLFILKYGIRQNYISHYLLVVIYILAIVLSLSIIKSLKNKINKVKNFNSNFILFSILICVVFIGINVLIDGNALNTDRWSALEVSVKSVLNLEYPYDKLDHLQGTSSNLPGLIYLGIPFYLLGDVGFLQPFIFLLIIFTLLKLKISSYKKVVFTFLLLLSPSYLWEIFAKSDLMSNLFLTIIFISLWDQKFKKDYYKSPILLAILVSFLILTRMVVAIPITLFLFKSFIQTNLKTKVKFLGTIIISILFFSSPILFSLPNKETLILHNPFNNQTMHSPIWVMLLSSTIPFILSIYAKSFKNILYLSFLILSSFLFYLFFTNAIEEGFNKNLYETLFDISYLGMIIPLILFYSIQQKLTLKLNN